MIIAQHTIAVMKPLVILDDAGQTIRDWGEVHSSWGRVSPMTAKDRLIAQQERVVANHKLFISSGIEVTAGDRVKCLRIEYDVLWIFPTSTGTHQEALLKRIVK